MALLVSDMVTAVRVLEIYQQARGALPVSPQQLAIDMGLFQKNDLPADQPKRDLRDAVICGLYMVPGAGVKGKQALSTFVANHPTGFKAGTNVLIRDQTTFDGNYAKVAVQLGRYKVSPGCPPRLSLI